jgi:hypothetical protein
LFLKAWQDAACESTGMLRVVSPQPAFSLLDKCWVQNHSDLFRLSEPFHDKAIEIHKIEARLEACDPADPSRATLQASLDTLAPQQKESKTPS